MNQIVVGNEVAAQAIVDAVNAALGLPKCTNPARYPDAQAWIDNGQVGPPPPHGLFLTVTVPTQHPDTGQWSVQLPADTFELVRGMVIAGVGPLSESHLSQRGRDWLPDVAVDILPPANDV